MSEKSYEFKILGQKIVIKNAEEAALAELAVNIVNEKIEEIQAQKPQFAPIQISILALMEIAGNLVKDRQAIDEYRKKLDQKCSSLMSEVSRVRHPDAVI